MPGEAKAVVRDWVGEVSLDPLPLIGFHLQKVAPLDERQETMAQSPGSTPPAGSLGLASPEPELLPRMTVWEALLASTIVDEAAELRRRGPRFGDVFFLVLGAPETEHDRLQERFTQFLQRAETNLRERLKSGELVGTGHDPRDPFSPRQKIPAGRWPHVKIDYVNSTIEVGPVKIIEVEITAVGGLYLNKPFRRARLGAVDLNMSSRSFDLLLTLAEGAKKEVPFVSLAELEKKHFDRKNNDKAVGQGIEELRIQLRGRIGRGAADRLIANLRGKGYRMNMPAAEITIEH